MIKFDSFRTHVCSIAMLICLAPATQAARTDVVVLQNGDSVTGEVKSLSFGELRYSTDSMGTVNIEWEEIVSLVSDQSLQVEVTSGTRYFGNLLPAKKLGTIVVGRGENVHELEILEVVRITPIETDERIWQRLEGSISFGFDTDKASSVTSAYLNGSVRYRTRTFLLGLNVNQSVTDQPGAPTTENRLIGMNYQRFRPNRWYTDWFGSTEKNDAQGIEQRLTLGGGLGRYVLQSNFNQLSILGGLVATRESFIGPDPHTTNAEGKVEITFRHQRKDPDASFTLTTNYFPRLNELSNFRSDTSLSWRREFIEDLFFDLSMYYKYLSDPPAGAQKEDYGVVSSLGYSF